ncbi:hypothetical protein M407DRAFT_20328, partial [Tulasnella calospora MUT 4182]
MLQPTRGLVTGPGKRKLSPEGADEHGGSSQEPKRLKLSLRAVVEALSEWRMSAENLMFFDNNAQKKGGSADVTRAGAVISRPRGWDNRSRFIAQGVAVESVAVKKFRLADDTNRRTQAACFANELSLLSELYHENIVRLIGFVENAEEKVAWILLHWEGNGNCREFILSQDWVIPERLSLIHDVACGLEYLHSRDPPICHGDLKSLNVLVTSQNRAVITDFGSARKLGTHPRRQKETTVVGRATPAESTMSQAQGRGLHLVTLGECGTFITLTGPIYTLRWASPELLNEGPSSLASDMWAFAWICWEIMTGKLPFDDLNRESHIVLRVTKGNLPPVASHKEISQVRALCVMMTRCWEMEPASRPAAEEFEGSLSMMDRIVPSNRDRTKPENYSTELLCSLGYTKRNINKYEEAEDYFGRALRIARSAGNAVATANAIQGLKTVYCAQGKCLEAEALTTGAKEMYTLLGAEGKVAGAMCVLGEVYRIGSQYSKAEAMHNEAKDTFQRHGDEHGVADALLGLGDIDRRRREFLKAEALYEEAKEIYKRHGLNGKVAVATCNLGEIYCVREEYSKAEATYNEAKEICERLGDEQGVARAAWGLGEVYWLWKEYYGAEVMYEKAKEVCERLGDEQGVARAALGLGDAHSLRKAYSKAEAMFNEAKNICERFGDAKGVARAAWGLGEVHWHRKEYSEAEAMNNEAKETCERLGLKRGVADAARGLGDVLLGLGDIARRRREFPKAEALYEETKEIYKRQELNGKVAVATCNLGKIYRLREEYSKAEAMYNEAKEICERLGDERGVAYAACGLGEVHRFRKEYYEAQAMYSKAKEIRERLGDERGVAYAACGLGEVHRFLNEYSEAQAMYSKAKEICERLRNERGVAYAACGLGEVHRFRKEYSEAQA